MGFYLLSIVLYVLFKKFLKIGSISPIIANLYKYGKVRKITVNWLDLIYVLFIFKRQLTLNVHKIILFFAI